MSEVATATRGPGENIGSESHSTPIRVVHMMPDLMVGGGQHLLLRNIKGMDPSRVKSYVCCVRALGDMEEAYRAAGVEVLCLNMRSGTQLIQATRQLAAIVKRENIDIIHTNNTVLDRTVGQLAALRTGRPVVNSLHSEHESSESISKKGLKSLPRRIKREFGIRLGRATVKHVLPVSGSVKESWWPYLRAMKIRPEQVTVVHPGLAPERFVSLSEAQRTELRRTVGVDDANPLLINVGRLNYGKGQHWLVPMMKPALEKHPKAKLILVGDGQDRQVLTESIRSLGLESSVIMLGQRSDVTQLLNIADLFVFPSLTEGFPLAVLEAMAAGKVMVGFRLPSFRECVEEEKSGVLVPIGDSEALTKAVLEVLADPARMREMGLRSRAIAERFTQRSTSEKLESVYASLVAARGK
jgi:glycosyltransferase involved in cell wall biosynthesis